MILGNNEVLKTLMKTLIFVDANAKADPHTNTNTDANANAGGLVHCSGEPKMVTKMVTSLLCFEKNFFGFQRNFKHIFLC